MLPQIKALHHASQWPSESDSAWASAEAVGVHGVPELFLE